MPTYYCFKTQRGEGCDYSIDCGKQLKLLRAKTMEDAIKEVVDVPDGWKETIKAYIDNNADVYDYIHEMNLDLFTRDWNQISSCEILEVSNQVDLEQLIRAKQKEVNNYVKELQEAKKVSEEYQQYLKLKEKFKK